MEYPHGRHPHHPPHHGGNIRSKEEEEQRRYGYPPPPLFAGDAPPPPFFAGDAPPPPFFAHAPPPPQAYHTIHTGPPGPESFHPTPPLTVTNIYPPPGPGASDHHHHHPHTPHFPPAASHHRDEDEFSNKPSVKMYCKAEKNYSLTIRDGKVVLAPADPSDPLQHWIKDEKFSTRVKDEEGFPSFALVNKATKQAIKHSSGATHPVQLTAYNANAFDESILWTESKDLGDGHRAIRMVNNIRLNIDAFNGDKNHGGVRDGTPIVLWEWKKGDNQRWKIVPY